MKTLFDHRPTSITKIFVKAVVWVALCAAVIWLVMLLWNWLIPSLFVGARTIDYWQTLGLIVLSRILFGGGHGRWKARQRWDSMSVEEREQLKRKFKSRWGASSQRPTDRDNAEKNTFRTSNAASPEFGQQDGDGRGDTL